MFAFGLALLATPGAARAHGMNPSLYELHERRDGRVDVLWRTSQAEGSQAPLSPGLPTGCTRVGPPRRDADGLGESERFELACPGGGLAGREISVVGLEARGEAEVFVRIELREGQSVVRVLRPSAPRLTLPAERSRLGTLRDYLRLGIHHILTGYDHLLFLLGLLLLVHAPRALVGTLTAFTAAHSLTLSLATLGWVRFPTRPGEAVIALSIVFLAFELTRAPGTPPSWSQRRPWAVAFAFGLIHGFGFAGALAEVGLPARDVPLALLGFNLGVEAGQLACVAGAMALAGTLRRLAPRLVALAPRPLAYVMGSLASALCIERILALGS